MLSKQTKKRLLKLADYLDNKVPSRNFDLSDFVSAKEGEIHNLKDHTCGSAACAIGYMPMVFKDCKYHWNSIYEWYEVIYDDWHIGFDAAEVFFGLSSEHVSYLFDPNWYPNKRQYKKYVTNRIRNFVKSNGKIPNHMKVY